MSESVPLSLEWKDWFGSAREVCSGEIRIMNDNNHYSSGDIFTRVALNSLRVRIPFRTDFVKSR